MGKRRRARADQYAERVNRAVALLGGQRSPAWVRRALQVQYALSERQARRYVRAAQASPGGVAVPERTAVFTVRLPVSVTERARSHARSERRGLGALTSEALQAHLDRHGGGGAAI